MGLGDYGSFNQSFIDIDKIIIHYIAQIHEAMALCLLSVDGFKTA
jgi:hypothetical protein